MTAWSSALLWASLSWLPSLELGVAGPSEPVAATSEQAPAVSAFEKIKVTQGDAALEHPGYRIELGERGIYQVQAGAVTHEVAVTIVDAGSDYGLNVEYRRDGQMVTTTSLKAKAKTYTSLPSLPVAVYLDPQGANDESRRDKIDMPKSDDPLAD